MKEVHLTQLNLNTTGVVRRIEGGHGVRQKLEALGIRPGKRVTVVSSHFWRGPVTVRMDKAQVAIGHGMAERIVVEVESG